MSTENILLKVEPKKEKIRWGLYLDKELHEVVREIAELNDLSYNETVNALIKAGIKASKE